MGSGQRGRNLRGDSYGRSRGHRTTRHDLSQRLAINELSRNEVN